MDFKELSLLRISPRCLRPSSEKLQLWASQKPHLTKITYCVISRWMDSKWLTLLRLFPRVFRSPSLISPLRYWEFLYDWNLTPCSAECSLCELSSLISSFLPRLFLRLPVYLNSVLNHFPSPDRSSELNFKIMASALFTNCELNFCLHRSILYLQDYGYPDDKFLTYHFDEWNIR